MNKEMLSITADCALCRRGDRAALAAMKSLGASGADLASASQSTVEEVQRHFSSCVPPIPEDVTSASDAELARLLRDANELYVASVLQNAMPAAAQALSVRGRAGNELRRREELKQVQADALSLADPSAPPREWPLPVQQWANRFLDAILARTQLALEDAENE